MKWYETAVSRRYALWGIVGGLIFPIMGTFVEIVTHAMPLAFSSIWSVQRDQPLLWMIDTLPLIFGFLAANLGAQRGLASVVQRGKKEWEAIFDSFSDPILVTDANGHIIRGNHAVIDRLNTTYTFLIGKPLAEVLMTTEHGPGADSQNNENGFSWLGRLYDVSTFPIQVEGAASQNLFILHDITQRHEMQSSLSLERKLLRTLIDNLLDRIYVKDVQGRKTLSNLADWRASGGKQMGDVLGKSDFDLYPADLAAKFWEDDKAVLDSGNAILNHEEPGLDADGNTVWIMTTKAPLRDDQGQMIGLVGIGRDITERKRVEAELLREKQFLETLNVNIPVAIIVLTMRAASS